jgi:hypothetical protein
VSLKLVKIIAPLSRKAGVRKRQSGGVPVDHE